mgnify:CR=1 FL=1|tara:strand:+ start:2333 stop:3037 length:705 start_codon:yes stop_codon:yes gene_type:complete
MKLIKSFISLLILLFIASLSVQATDSDFKSDNNSSRPSFHRFIDHGNFDFVGFDETDFQTTSTKSFSSNHAYVPNSSGIYQDRRHFSLLFSGDEDLSTVRIQAQVPKHQLTFREKLKLLFYPVRPVSYLSGTMTEKGILTNGHGFIEEVPSVTNSLRKFFGLESLHYRVLEPIHIEQGVSLKKFEPANDNLYHHPEYIYHFFQQLIQVIDLMILSPYYFMKSISKIENPLEDGN